MCKPLFFQVDYEINPWMHIGSVDEKKAMRQWKDLVSLYEKLGVKVHIIDQQKNVPDMVFAVDQGIINNKKILLSNFRYPERRDETLIYEPWFRNYGLEIVKMPHDVYFEGGGETVKWQNILFIGTGFRTSPQALPLIENDLGVKVLGLELIDKRFYHLDTCFFVLDEKTAFYFPDAFSQKSIRLLKKNIPSLIKIPEKDALQFATNSVVIDKTVVIQSGNIHFAQLIKEYGYSPVMTDVNEFIKAGGAIHCLTRDLDGS